MNHYVQEWYYQKGNKSIIQGTPFQKDHFVFTGE